MRQILLIGIGQTGSTVADLFLNKLNNSDVYVRSLAIDTDEEGLSNICAAQKVLMTDECSLATVVERLGEDEVSRYFPCIWGKDNSITAKGLEMRSGTNLWRMKAFLAFNSFLSKIDRVEELHATLDSFVKEDGESEVEIYTAASLV